MELLLTFEILIKQKLMMSLVLNNWAQIISFVSCIKSFQNRAQFSYHSSNPLLCVGERSERVGDLDRDRERESIFRIRDRRRLDTTLRDEALKSLERDKVEGFTTDSIKKNQNPSASPLLFGENLHYWAEMVRESSR